MNLKRRCSSQFTNVKTKPKEYTDRIVVCAMAGSSLNDKTRQCWDSVPRWRRIYAAAHMPNRKWRAGRKGSRIMTRARATALGQAPFNCQSACCGGPCIWVIAYFGWVGLTMPIDWGRGRRRYRRVGQDFGGAFSASLNAGGLLIDGFLESPQDRGACDGGACVFFSIPIALCPQVNVAPSRVFYLAVRSSSLHAAVHPVILWRFLSSKRSGRTPLRAVLTLTVYSIGFVARCCKRRIEEDRLWSCRSLRAAGAPYFSTLSVCEFFSANSCRARSVFERFLPSLIPTCGLCRGGDRGAGGIGATARQCLWALWTMTLPLPNPPNRHRGPSSSFPRPSAASSESVSNDLTFYAIRARRLARLYPQATQMTRYAIFLGLRAGDRRWALTSDRGDLALGPGAHLKQIGDLFKPDVSAGPPNLETILKCLWVYGKHRGHCHTFAVLLSRCRSA